MSDPRYPIGKFTFAGPLTADERLAAIEAIVAAREGRGEGPNGDQTGPFTSLFNSQLMQPQKFMIVPF